MPLCWGWEGRAELGFLSGICISGPSPAQHVSVLCPNSLRLQGQCCPQKCHRAARIDGFEEVRFFPKSRYPFSFLSFFPPLTHFPLKTTTLVLSCLNEQHCSTCSKSPARPNVLLAASQLVLLQPESSALLEQTRCLPYGQPACQACCIF